MTEETNNESTIGKHVGNVLWFDQKKGYGFVKIINPDSEFLNNEIFVHYSSIKSGNNFKKLFPGENISLDVERNKTDSNKEYISNNVTGLFGTKLLVDNENHIIKVIKKRNIENQEQ